MTISRAIPFPFPFSRAFRRTCKRRRHAEVRHRVLRHTIRVDILERAVQVGPNNAANVAKADHEARRRGRPRGPANAIGQPGEQKGDARGRAGRGEEHGKVGEASVLIVRADNHK